jgi:hypothetical protein
VKSDPDRELAARQRWWVLFDMERVVEAAPVTLVDEPLYDQEDDEDNAVVEVDITEVLDNIQRNLDAITAAMEECDMDRGRIRRSLEAAIPVSLMPIGIGAIITGALHAFTHWWAIWILFTWALFLGLFFSFYYFSYRGKGYDYEVGSDEEAS